MLQNSNGAAAAHSAASAVATPAAAASAAAAAAAAAVAAAANNAALAASSIQPKLIVIRRRPNQGFGFTLRHFIAYPPEDDQASSSASGLVSGSATAATAASVSTNWPQEASSAAGSNSGSSSSVGVAGITGLEPTSPTSLPPYQVKAMETIFIKEVQANGPAHYANLQTGDRVLMVNNQPIAGIAYSTIVSMIKQTPAVLTLHVVPKECDVLQMHYTSIAHTPESNRLTMSTHSPSLLANGSHKTTFPAAAAVAAPPHQHQQQQQQLISYPAVAAVTTSTPAGSPQSQSQSQSHSHPNTHHAPSLHGGSRSGSITSTASGGITVLSQPFYPQQQQQQQQQQQHRHPALTGGSSSIDFGDMAHGLRQHQQQQQHLYQQQQQHHQFMRANQPPNLTVLSASSATNTPTPTARQPKSATSHNQALYAVGAGPSSAAGSGSGSLSGGSENSDLMIRLRESIKQKEEFLKSPVPASMSSASSINGNQAQSSSPAQQQHLQQHQQHFFPSHTPPGGVQVVVPPPRSRHQVMLKQQQQQQQQHQQHHVLGYDMYHSGGKLVQRSSTAPGSVCHQHQQQQQHHLYHQQQHQQLQQTQHRQVMINNNAKYAKDLDYFETLQETGVTNKVFERKLVSHMSKGFDPFKPLSINTSALESSASTSSTSATTTVKKQSVLYESLQQHPLAKYHQTQQQTTTTTTVDGQTSSRMELHKATLANATIDPVPVGSSTAAIVDSASGSGNVVRRYKPLSSSSFDEGKPMRRISYLRATNNETDFNAEAAAGGDAAATGASGPASASAASSAPGPTPSSAPAPAPAPAPLPISIPIPVAAVVEPQKTKSLVEEHPDPTYDVIGGTGGGHEFIETPNGLEDVRLSAHGSRRASMSSDMRSSIHIDAELNGKYVPNELEAFETEIEIKSSCINGKRMSEYRSWRQVKLEIKGDLLRIYSGRHAKSEHNVIELDIRNFKFFDESMDKKKYLIRMQSKPSPSGAHLASLGNELNLDEGHDKLLTSSGSSSANEPAANAASALTASTSSSTCSSGPYTEILFKTKSSNEMKRLFGLLQWKDSLNYDDNEHQPQGKQLAEPQKTVASASYLDDVQGGASAADSSPLSSHSGGIADASGSHHVSALPAAAAIVAATSDSISPVMKARKSSSHKHIPDKDLGSPKSKNWKDLLFRRGGSGSGGVSHHDLASPSACAAKQIGSIGVPLRSCPMSKVNAYVPHLVEVCTNIVETKGLGVVGIYRIPGNKAAISELSELVNTKDFQFESCASDDRWEDVNVVSSLLKLFIRSLPDALMPASYYINFIEADKKFGLERIVLLREIVESLPRHPYETMKHLIRHLCRVSGNCDVNRMEPKNLAIIFGPSIIRTPNDTLETAVKDMKHQCRIVELLVTQYDYFFEGGSLPDIAEVSGGTAAVSAAQPQQQTQEDQTSMLLHNLSKIERITERETTRTSRFMPQLRRKTHGKRSAVNSDTYSGESVLVSGSSSNTTTTTTTTTHTTSSTSSSNTITTTISTTTIQQRRAQRKAVQSICDQALILLLPTPVSSVSLPFQSLDYAKASASASASASSTASTSSSSTLHSGGKASASSSSSSTTKFSSSSSSACSTTAVAISSSISATSSKLLSANFKKRSTGGFLGSRSSHQTRKASLDEKDSGQSSGSLGHSLGVGINLAKEQQRSSVDISILLTDDDSSSRLSDTGSMSLTTITDTLDSKLRNLRSGSESNDENGSPEFPKNRRHTLGQPLHMHSENIPYADESPERLFHQFCNPLETAPLSLHLSRSCTATNTIGGDEKPSKQSGGVAPLPPSLLKAAHKLQHSATVPIHQGSSTAPTSGAATPVGTPTGSGGAGAIPSRSSSSSVTTLTKSIQPRFSNYLSYERGNAAAGGAERVVGSAGGAASDDDSEGSTTSDPKEKLLLGERPSPSFFIERYNKKRRDHRLFRSASFNCRNYSTRHITAQTSGGVAAGVSGGVAGAVAVGVACCQALSTTGLTKDEKTDMNLTKKRQIQNKQNRSIKRRHTVGGPHDYSASNGGCSNHSHGHDLAAINYNHHNRHHQQQLLKLGSATSGGGGSGAAAAETTTTTTTTTTVLRRLGTGQAGAEASVALPASSSGSSSNNNNSPQSDGSNGNGGGVAGVASNAPPTGVGVGGNNSSGSSSNSSSTSTTPAGNGDQVLEVGIRIKNISRGRF
uniref:Rho GTPase activating protein at 19D, isoform A n=2 Tax=Drosophila melanogaster TaxID=7227 RepID=Q9VRA6_DROME|nr:Rho GTPase activating protein at 19D, isoform A [Drosophila melanogaster]AAF50897.2 Rho GTPase activating protein at 19D, isoform A [Drosophila melanogaster]|eukprot:NP_608396.2 Rho GTPase activating protein at 19D, isoform A [Drosophila melanogaster]